MSNTKGTKKTADKNTILVKGYRPLKRKDMGNRFYAFLLDISVMLSPIAIWNILLLCMFGNIVGTNGIGIISFIVLVLVVLSVLFVNNYIIAKSKGQSLGMKFFQLRVIGSSGKIAYKRKLVLRETIGFAIPFLLLLYFTSIIGVIFYWFVNGVIVFFEPQHRSIIDFIMRTKVVAVDTQAKQAQQVQSVRKAQAIKEPVPPVATAPLKATTTIDLHIHSNFSSNGQYNVEEIFQKAKEKGLKTISITDLDSAKSIPIARRMSDLYKIRYIPGIEMNCDIHGRRVRLLGYFINAPHEIFNQIENDSLLHEKQASIERVRKFEKIIGMSVPVEQLLENNRFQRIPGEMIAEYVLKQEKYQDAPILQPYLYGSKSLDPYREMAKDLFAYGKLCYVPVKYPDIQDVLDVIHLTDGVAILAHPGKLLANAPEELQAIMRMKIDGLEVFHPDHTKQDTTTLLKMAIDRKLFISAGSDFYTQKKQDVLGKTGCPENAEKIVEMFINA